MITGKLYDRLKWVAQILLPAFGTLYFALAQIWGVGSGAEVVGSVMAIDLFLGTLLGISQANYNKAIEDAGILFVDKDGKKTFQIDGDQATLDELADKQEVRFKVVNASK